MQGRKKLQRMRLRLGEKNVLEKRNNMVPEKKGSSSGKQDQQEGETEDKEKYER